jgi:hypothetical protein
MERETDIQKERERKRERRQTEREKDRERQRDRELLLLLRQRTSACHLLLRVEVAHVIQKRVGHTGRPLSTELQNIAIQPTTPTTAWPNTPLQKKKQHRLDCLSCQRESMSVPASSPCSRRTSAGWDTKNSAAQFGSQEWFMNAANG